MLLVVLLRIKISGTVEIFAVSAKFQAVDRDVRIQGVDYILNIPLFRFNHNYIYKMLIRQSKNSFIRTTKKYGYIVNQLTRMDRCYDETGADWLREISREPQDLDDIVHRLMGLYDDADLNTLRADFCEFVGSLAEHRFVVIGETVDALDQADLDFTYSIENPKTLISDVPQLTKEEIPNNTQEVFFGSIKESPSIVNLQFELTSRCNERCIHCYIPNNKKNKGDVIPTEKVKSIIDEYAEMGGLQVSLSGGEAFLHRDIIEIARYCREKDMKISILSNLMSVTDAQIAALKKLNISVIQVSLYSMDPEKHDYITTVKGSFYRTKASIEKLVEADIPVQISCPVMKANLEGYEKVLEYAQSLKIKAHSDFIMMARSDLDTKNLDNRLSLVETEQILRTIIEKDIDYRESTLQQLPISDRIQFDLEKYLAEPVCGVGYDNCCIAANGDVYPCAGWQGFVLGNVYENSLREIWNNSDRVKFLRTITHSSFPQCVVCEARDYCAACLVRNFNESGGDMFAVNPHFCDVAFLTKRLVEEYKAKGMIH